MLAPLRLICVVAAAAALLVLVATPAAAVSSGALGVCDQTPVKVGGYTFSNGCFGKNPWGNTCNSDKSGPMTWAWAAATADWYTMRSSDVGTNATLDGKTYTPGGSLNELHLRTLKLDRRIIGLLLYATNGTDPVTKKETRVGTWRVLPATSGGFQVPVSCGYTAVTHNGAEVKPLHARFWFAAPAGTGTVRFRVLIKEGVQGRGNFWTPFTELSLAEGKAPALPPQNQPAVWGSVTVNGKNVSGIVKPAVNVTVATGAEQKLPVLGALGQNCADACAQQLPATPFCHRAGSVAISSSKTLLAAIGTKVQCSLPVLGGCPYAGAARVTQTDNRSSCFFRSVDAVTTCPAWALSSSTVSAASLFAAGTSSVVDRASPQYLPDVCFTAAPKGSQNVCVCTNNKAAQGSNPFTLAAIAAVQAGAKPATASKTIASKSAAAPAADSTGAAAGRAPGAAFALCVGLLSAVFGLSSSRVSGSKLSLLLLAVLAALALVSSPVCAHNYMRGLHRASEASVTRPCQARLGNDPHVQIVAGQTFEMEFTNGHGNAEGTKKTLFVILHESDYDQLRAVNITSILRDYLDKAPASAFRSAAPDAGMWERQHRCKNGDYCGNGTVNWEDPAGMSPSDPRYIAVDPIYNEKTHPNPYPATATVKHLRVHPNLMAQFGPDRRAVYKSALYPWIESVDEFINPYNRDNLSPGDFFSHQGDIARFNFTARQGPGNYIAWYSWSGYGDCVDINVMPGKTPVKYRYGRNATELGSKQYAIKVDHCQIRNVATAATMMYRLDPVTHDASQCVKDCLALGWTQCSAVQVVRATNPVGTVDWEPNIPWIHYYWNQTGWDRNERDWPCRCDNVHECIARGCTRTTLAQIAREGWRTDVAAFTLANNNCDPANYPNLKDDDYFCYGTKPGRNQDNQVDEDWVLADDPSDPVWYSTCYLTATSGGYLNVAPIVPEPIEYLTDSTCQSCDWYKQASNFSLAQAPAWDKGLLAASADKCADCTLRGSKPPAAATTRAAQVSLLVGADVAFSGYNATAERAEYNAAVKAAAAASAAGGGSSTKASSTGAAGPARSSSTGGRAPNHSSSSTGAQALVPSGGGGGGSNAGAAGGDNAEQNGNDASANASNSSKDSKILGLAKLPGILVLVAIGVGGLLLLGGVAFAVKSLGAARRGSNSDLRKLQAYSGEAQGSTELQANPVFQRL